MDRFNFDDNDRRRGRESGRDNPGRGNQNPPRPQPPRPQPPRPQPPRPQPPRPQPPRPQPPRPQPPRPRPIPIPIPVPQPKPVDQTITVRNAVITDVNILPTGTFVTISYEVFNVFNQFTTQLVQLIITQNTLILNQLNQRISVWGLREGMRVNATFSTAMTRSNPPQSVAIQIRIVAFR